MTKTPSEIYTIQVNIRIVSKKVQELMNGEMTKENLDLIQKLLQYAHDKIKVLRDRMGPDKKERPCETPMCGNIVEYEEDGYCGPCLEKRRGE